MTTKLIHVMVLLHAPKDEELLVKTRGKTRGKTRDKILSLIAENPQVTIAELANTIGITEKGIDWQIQRLKKDGILERIGPAKGGHCKVNQG